LLFFMDLGLYCVCLIRRRHEFLANNIRSFKSQYSIIRPPELN
jgi:hypothetical protein